MDDLMARLADIAETGDPAHAARAQDFLAILRTDPRERSTLDAAKLLIDAYLNDPYLTR